MNRCAQIDQLKQRLLHADDTAESLGAVVDFYLDHVGTVAGKPIPPVAFLDQALSKFTGLPFVDTPLKRVAECHFAHCSYTANGEPGNLIYFEDERKGLMALVVSESPPRRKYARFTVPAPHARVFPV